MNNVLQNADMNQDPRSETMFDDKPSYLYIEKKSRICSLVIVLVIGIKYVIFVNRSTRTRIELKDLEHGRSIMKSIEINGHGLLRIGSGCNKPYGWWCCAFTHAHILQVWMNSFRNFHICGHQKSFEISFMVFFIPKCLIDGQCV